MCSRANNFLYVRRMKAAFCCLQMNSWGKKTADGEPIIAALTALTTRDYTEHSLSLPSKANHRHCQHVFLN